MRVTECGNSFEDDSNLGVPLKSRSFGEAEDLYADENSLI